MKDSYFQTRELRSIKNQVKEAMLGGTPELHEHIFWPLGIKNDDRFSFIDKLINAEICEHSDLGRLAPRLVHRMWLTNTELPSMPRKYYLDRISKQCSQFGPNIKNIFWYNSEHILDYLAEALPAGGFEFRNIELLQTEPVLLQRIYRAIEAKKFVLAGDMTKFLIIRQCGGIYADLGIGFDPRLADIALSADMSLFLDQNVFFQPAFMVAPPNHRFFRLWCCILRQPEIISAICLKDQRDLKASHEIWMHGGVAFTAILMLMYDNSFNILPIVPNRGSLHHESEGSWYRAGNRYGNVTLDDAPVTHLDLQLHNQCGAFWNAFTERPGKVSAARAGIIAQIIDFFWLN